MDLLTREIIRKLFSNVGASPGDFGKYSLTSPEHLCPFTLDLTYENDESVTIRSPVYAGELEVNDSVIRALLVDLSGNEISEYALVFQSAGNPIYGAKLIFDDADNGMFLIRNPKGWIDASTVAKCKALIGFEIIASYGMKWNPAENVDELFRAASALVAGEPDEEAGNP